MLVQNNSEDVTCLIFWFYNATLWLHLMQCDNSINDTCEMLGSFELLEQVVNSVFGKLPVILSDYAEYETPSFHHSFRREENRPVAGCCNIR